MNITVKKCTILIEYYNLLNLSTECMYVLMPILEAKCHSNFEAVDPFSNEQEDDESLKCYTCHCHRPQTALESRPNYTTALRFYLHEGSGLREQQWPLDSFIDSLMPIDQQCQG